MRLFSASRRTRYQLTPAQTTRSFARLLAGLVSCLLIGCFASEPTSIQDNEDTVELSVDRDTWVSSVTGERQGNNGGASQMKIKSFQEISVFDVEPEPALTSSSRVILAAEIVVKPDGNTFPQRVSISTVSTPWSEGNGKRYSRRTKGASFDSPGGKRSWTDTGSDFSTAALGAGETLWSQAEPAADGAWVTIPFDPRLVAARRTGLSHGFALFDDVGSEYTRQGEQFAATPFPNRFFASRQGGRSSSPHLRLKLGPADNTPPEAVTELQVLEAPVDGPGEARLRFLSPADRGPAGVLGFDVAVAPTGAVFDWDAAEPLPRHNIAFAPPPGQPVEIHLRDLGEGYRPPLTVGVRAVDAVGHRGPTQTVQLERAETDRRPLALELKPSRSTTKTKAAASIDGPGGGRVWVTEPSLRVDPTTGDTIPARQGFLPKGSRHSPQLWDRAQAIVLAAARNEFVSFSLVLEDVPGEPQVALTLPPPLKGRLYRVLPVEGRQDAAGELLVDPLVELENQAPLPSSLPNVPGSPTFRTVLVQIYVPHEARAGSTSGHLQLGPLSEVSIPIRLQVANFTLPDHLSFRPQLNAYRLPAEAGGPKQIAHYRLAHEHRTVLNRLTYNWQGQVRDGHAPVLTPSGFDFDAWEQAFSPLFDGSAFVDLPRKGVPIEAFYLPVHENWPVEIAGSFLGGYWAEEAIAGSYFDELEDRLSTLASHLGSRGFTETSFEVYLNNRVKFKAEAGLWSASTAPWNFDEPLHMQDFWALRRFGLAVQRGNQLAAKRTASQAARLDFRVDVSRPQWQRDLFDEVVQTEVVGHEFYRYRREILDRQRKAARTLYNYGTPSRPSEPAHLMTAWCVLAWADGADGVIPWQSLGEDHSWIKEDNLSLIYPARGKEIAPHPSLRLKALLRGQQDAEYLALLEANGWPRWQLRQLVYEAFGMDPEVRPPVDRKHLPDIVGQVTMEQLSALRDTLRRELDRLAPEPQTRLIDFRLPLSQPTEIKTWRTHGDSP